MHPIEIDVHNKKDPLAEFFRKNHREVHDVMTRAGVRYVRVLGMNAWRMSFAFMRKFDGPELTFLDAKEAGATQHELNCFDTCVDNNVMVLYTHWQPLPFSVEAEEAFTDGG